jgi:subtilisin family serine protease
MTHSRNSGRPVGGADAHDDDERLRDQLRILLEGPEAVPGAVAMPPNWADIDPETKRLVGIAYIARANHVLVRDADLPRVREVLPPPPPRGDGEGAAGSGGIDPLSVSREGVVGDDGSVASQGNLSGLSLYAYDPDSPVARGRSLDAVIDYLDRRLGVGVATPDHLLYLVNGTTVSIGGTCPATEPEPVHTPTRPYPDPCTCPGDGSGVLVWVLDSGLLSERLAPWLAEGVDGDEDQPYSEPVADELIRPYAGHGTFCAGVLRTVAPEAKVFVAKTFVRVADGTPNGAVVKTNAGFFESHLAEAVPRALQAGAQVLSLAFGTYTRKNLALLSITVLHSMVNEQGAVLVAAAGNDQQDRKFWPAAFPDVVSVGALSRNLDSRAWFSNFGLWVKVYAPGEDLVNAYVVRGALLCREAPNKQQRRDFRGMARWSGTSFATPLVAGLIATRMSQTGRTAREAATDLVAEAPVVPGLGRVVLPEPCPQPYGCSRGCAGANCACGFCVSGAAAIG